ncbi:unnamed protein product [Toxocara canis]|uniref:Secreted protein n=1 Tax=Toxocara canis TaxID=6265 RepID=A0A183UUL1_TOXCA|nr:unnamed protein product [Toxocara canis]
MIVDVLLTHLFVLIHVDLQLQHSEKFSSSLSINKNCKHATDATALDVCDSTVASGVAWSTRSSLLTLSIVVRCPGAALPVVLNI